MNSINYLIHNTNMCIQALAPPIEIDLFRYNTNKSDIQDTAG